MDAIEPAMAESPGMAAPGERRGWVVEPAGAVDPQRGNGRGTMIAKGAGVAETVDAGGDEAEAVGVSESDLAALHASTFGWALTCCRFDRDEAEEVLQTSYLKVLEGRARFRGQSSLRTFLFGVVRRTAGAQRRLRFARILSLTRWSTARGDSARLGSPQTTRLGSQQVDPAPDPEVLSAQAQEDRRLRALLMRLSPRQREVLHLVFYQEMTIEEAAEIQNVSLGSARTHYERGKAAMRRMLREENDR